MIQRPGLGTTPSSSLPDGRTWSVGPDRVAFDSHDPAVGGQRRQPVPTSKTRASKVHPTLYANGPVAWIEKLMVRGTDRHRGIGRELVEALERWAKDRSTGLVALATRRADVFWQAVGYEKSATYFRNLLAQ